MAAKKKIEAADEAKKAAQAAQNDAQRTEAPEPIKEPTQNQNAPETSKNDAGEDLAILFTLDTKDDYDSIVAIAQLVKKSGAITFRHDDEKIVERSRAAGRKTMNLAQKFVELRRACPEIIKKQHSDGVKYKFAKIFDVCELLAPTMNEWGVDWDIVKEEATRHYENGDAKFYDSFIQRTRNGERVVWVYEADITLRWINTDNPEETLEIVLHALGTNDSGPDKAKGSAWTYCLKYYLFEKFNIDQGEDDPDNADHSSDAPQNSQPRQQSARNGSQSVQRSAGISDAQLNRLYKKAEACGMTKKATDSRIYKRYKQENPTALTRAQYDEICASLDAAAKKKEEAANAQ